MDSATLLDGCTHVGEVVFTMYEMYFIKWHGYTTQVTPSRHGNRQDSFIVYLKSPSTKVNGLGRPYLMVALMLERLISQCMRCISFNSMVILLKYLHLDTVVVKTRL